MAEAEPAESEKVEESEAEELYECESQHPVSKEAKYSASVYEAYDDKSPQLLKFTLKTPVVRKDSGFKACEVEAGPESQQSEPRQAEPR